MEITDSFDEEVMSYDHSSNDNVEITKLPSLNNISSTGNEDDFILEPCLPIRVCISHPKGVKDEFFHFYVGELEDFKIRLPFSDFEVVILKIINFPLSQFRPNNRGFIKAFEIVCEAIHIVTTIGLVFSFFEVKGVEKVSQITICGIPRRSFLQVYTTNYKGFK